MLHRCDWLIAKTLASSNWLVPVASIQAWTVAYARFVRRWLIRFVECRSDTAILRIFYEFARAKVACFAISYNFLISLDLRFSLGNT